MMYQYVLKPLSLGALVSWFMLHAQAAPVVQVSEKTITQARWVLVDTTASVKKGVELQFLPKYVQGANSEGTLHISACNNLNGAYHINKGVLTASQGASTLIACPKESGEQLALELLQKASKGLRIQLNGSRMTLTDASSPALYYVFESQFLPSAAATTHFLEVAPARVPCTTRAVERSCLLVRDLKLNTDAIETGKGPWRIMPDNIVDYRHVEGVSTKLRIKKEKLTKPLQGYSNPIMVLDLVFMQNAEPNQRNPAYRAISMTE